MAFQCRYLEGRENEGVTFISSASMEETEFGESLSWKYPSCRKLKIGDIVTTEISAIAVGYWSQIHRLFAVGQPPTSASQSLFEIV